jgi:hypothetical protein
MKNYAPSRVERLSEASLVPAYPTIAPKTGRVQHVLAIALASPSRNARGIATGLVPAWSIVVFAHSATDKSHSIFQSPSSLFHSSRFYVYVKSEIRSTKSETNSK